MIIEEWFGGIVLCCRVWLGGYMGSNLGSMGVFSVHTGGGWESDLEVLFGG